MMIGGNAKYCTDVHNVSAVTQLDPTIHMFCLLEFRTRKPKERDVFIDLCTVVYGYFDPRLFLPHSCFDPAPENTTFSYLWLTCFSPRREKSSAQRSATQTTMTMTIEPQWHNTYTIQ
eukprot:scaffold2556_cov153-Skeletonema_menzelii.AAC.8